MMSATPLISVILPAYNAESTLSRSIDSILGQSEKNFELIVIDDGSVDGTRQLIQSQRDPRIRPVLHSRNLGLIETLNEAIPMARGKYIARQDADDESVPDRFRLQTRYLATHPDVSLVGSALHLRSDDGTVVGTWCYPEIPALARWQALFKTPVAHSSILARRDLFSDSERFDKAFKYAEDYELWSRLIEHAEFASLPDKLVYYSIGSGGVSRQRAAEQEAVHLRISKSKIDRFLGRSVGAEVVRLLSIGVDRPAERLDSSVVRSAFQVCAELAERYLARIESPRDRRAIIDDCHERLCAVLRSTPRSNRLGFLPALLAKTPLSPVGIGRGVLGVCR